MTENKERVPEAATRCHLQHAAVTAPRRPAHREEGLSHSPGPCTHGMKPLDGEERQQALGAQEFPFLAPFGPGLPSSILALPTYLRQPEREAEQRAPSSERGKAGGTTRSHRSAAPMRQARLAWPLGPCKKEEGLLHALLAKSGGRSWENRATRQEFGTVLQKEVSVPPSLPRNTGRALAHDAGPAVSRESPELAWCGEIWGPGPAPPAPAASPVPAPGRSIPLAAASCPKQGTPRRPCHCPAVLSLTGIWQLAGCEGRQGHRALDDCEDATTHRAHRHAFAASKRARALCKGGDVVPANVGPGRMLLALCQPV